HISHIIQQRKHIAALRNNLNYFPGERIIRYDAGIFDKCSIWLMLLIIKLEGSIMKNELKLVIDAKATLGEGPCWDDENKVLYWVDIMGMNLHKYDPATDENQTYHVGQLIGAAVPSESGGIVLALENGFYKFYPESE